MQPKFVAGNYCPECMFHCPGIGCNAVMPSLRCVSRGVYILQRSYLPVYFSLPSSGVILCSEFRKRVELIGLIDEMR